MVHHLMMRPPGAGAPVLVPEPAVLHALRLAVQRLRGLALRDDRQRLYSVKKCLIDTI